MIIDYPAINSNERVIDSMSNSPFWGINREIITYCDRKIIKTPLSINLPSHWSEYDCNKGLAIVIGFQYQLKPRLLLWGSPSNDKVEHIWWDAIRSNPSIYTLFMDKAADEHEQTLMRVILNVNTKATKINHDKGIDQVIYNSRN